MDQLQRRTMRELAAQGIEVSGADTDFAGIVRKPVVTSKVQLNGVGEYRQVPACTMRLVRQSGGGFLAVPGQPDQ